MRVNAGPEITITVREAGGQEEHLMGEPAEVAVA
jgi:hypothetical protein